MLNQLKKSASAMGKVTKLQAQQAKIKKLLSGVNGLGKSKNGEVTVIKNQEAISELNISPRLIEFVYQNFTSQGKGDTMLSKSIIEAVKEADQDLQNKTAQAIQTSDIDIASMMDMLN